MDEAHTLFRGGKCGLWLNFEGISSYSGGEWPIVLLHRTQRASSIPHSIANGVRTDTVMKWPADIFYQLWGLCKVPCCWSEEGCSYLLYFCKVTTQWYSGQEFLGKMVLSVKYVLVNSTKVPLEGPPGRLGWHLHHFLADPSLKHWKPFLHGGGRRQMLWNVIVKKISKPCVSLKLEKHLLKTGEANSDQKDQGKVNRALPLWLSW